MQQSNSTKELAKVKPTTSKAIKPFYCKYYDKVSKTYKSVDIKLNDDIAKDNPIYKNLITEGVIENDNPN